MTVFTLTYYSCSRKNIASACSNAALSFFRFILVILVPLLFFTQKGIGQVVTTFNTSGSFTVPAGVTSLKVEAWGAGAGGSSGIGGGGGGAFAGNNALTVVPGNTYTVTVGVGAAAGSGNPGGTSSFSTLVVAEGGGRGANILNGGRVANSTGAAGLVWAGGNGGNGTGNGGGGGGGSAGAGGAGGNGGNTNTNAAGAAGIAGIAGTGLAGAAGGIGGSSNGSGATGAVPGGGGGERGNSGSTSGGGGNGRVIVTYYLPPTISSVSPTAACTGSGATITITGTNFISGSVVKFFNNITASSTFISTTSLTAVVPAGAATGAITVTTPGGTATSSTFTVDALPTVNAGPGLTAICQGGNSVPLGGSVGGSATGGVWSTPAGGTFNPNASTLNATWTPPAGFSGTATLTLTTTGGSCTPVPASKSQVVNALPTATISYGGSPFCNTIVTPQAVTQTGIAGGTYSSTGGLDINSSTGDINPSTSTPGTYTVTYSFTNGTCSNTTTTSVTITALPVATFSYTGTPFCSVAANPLPTFSGGGIAGVFSSTAGLNFVNTSTGLINLGTSTANTYTITNTIAAAGGCPQVTATSDITIIAAPVATISYAGAPFCTSVAGPQAVTQTGTNGGTYSAPGGLAINSSTGEITPSSSTPGTYTVTYSFTDGTCSNTTTASVTITALPVGTFSYTGTPYCSNSANPIPTFSGGGVAGLFSSTVGLNFVSSATGQVNVSTSTPGGYVVTNTIAASGGCPVVSETANITVNAVTTPTFTTTPAASICTSTDVTYTTQAGQSAYIWTIPGVLGTNYSITSGGTSGTDNTVTIQWLTTGSKTVTVNYTNAAGCTSVAAASHTTTVNARPAVSFTSSAGASTCAVTNLTYTTQSGQSAYVWTVPGILNTDYTIVAGSLASNSNTVTLQWLTSGSKTVTVNYNNASGCSGLSAASNTTNVNLRPVAGAISGSNAVCVGSTITLASNATGAATLTYTWATSNGSFATVTNAGVVTGVAAGTPNITYTVTDGNGCTATSAAFPVTVNVRPVASFTASATANTCASTNVTYTTQAGQSNYTWTVPGILNTDYTITAGGVGTGSNTVTLQWLTTGSKTVTVNYTNSNGCSSAAVASNTTTVNARPVPSFTTFPPSPLCTSTSATYTTLAGQSNYTWTVPGVLGTDYIVTAGSLATGSNTATLQWLTAGSKTVTVNYNNASSCTGLSAASSTITVNARPVATFTATPSANTCASTDVTYTTQAGQSAYVWTVPGVLGTNYTITSGGISSTDNTVTIQWLTTGSKTVTVNYTNAAGCTSVAAASHTTNVNARPTPSFTASAGANTCAVTNVTYTTLAAQSAYVWTVPGILNTDYTIIAGGIGAGSNTVTLQWLTSGSKTVTVNYNNASGCSGLSAASNTTNVNLRPVAGAISGSNAVCVGSTITLASNATGAATLTYTWATSNGSFATVTNAGVVTGVGAGTPNITYTVTDGNGCTATSAAFPVTVNARPVASFTASATANTCASTNVTYTTQASQSNYIWTVSGILNTDYTITAGGVGTGSNTVTLQWLTTGSKTVTVNYTNSNGCSSAATASNTTTVNVRPVPSFTIFPPSPLCTSTPATYTTQSGQNTYVWAVPGVSGTDYMITAGGIGSTSSTVTIQWLTAGSKTVTVNYNNASSCTGLSAASSTITVNARPVATFTATPSANTCASTDVTYTTQAGQSAYVWTVPGVLGTNYTITSGGISSTDNTVTIQWLTTGSKTVTVNYTNAAGCTSVAAASHTTNVNARPTPSFTASAGANTCAVTNVTYTTLAGQSAYVWTVPGILNTDYTIIAGSLSSSSSTVTLQWLTSGSKTVTVNYNNGSGCSGLSAASNTTNVNLRPVVSTPASSVCVASTIVLSPTTGGTWVSSNNAVATVTNAGMVTGVSAGNATFTFTETATGCANTTSSVTVNALPVVAPITSGAPSICVNDITVFTNSTSGGTWSIVNGTGTATIDAGGLVTGLSAGTVTIVYTYSNGICTNTVTTGLTINSTPVVSPIGGGAASVCANGTTPAFTNATPGGIWSIINGTGSASIDAFGVVSGLSAGTVTVLYTISNGTCSNEEAVLLTIDPLPPVAAISGGVASICVNGATPAFTNATPGGVWSIINGTGTATIAVTGIVNTLTAGTVTVAYTITDGTCTNTATQSLTISPLPIVAPVTGGAATVCVNTSTPAFTDVTAGGVWSVINGTGTASIDASGIVTGLTPGTVTIVYTYNNGTCADAVNTGLVVNDLPLAGVITGAAGVCQGNFISLSSNASGSGALSYSWNSTNTSSATVTNAGLVTGVAAGVSDITYTVTDGNLCVATSAVFPVTVGASPAANITSSNSSICNGGSTNITGTVTANGAWILTLSDGSTTAGTGNGSFNIAVNPAITTIYTITSVVDVACTSIAANLTGSVTVTVNDAVSITSQPLAIQTVCSGGSVNFTVAATGTGLTYQWRKGATVLSNGGNISGATTSTLVINPVAIGDASPDYNVVVTGVIPCNPITSNNAELAVNEAVSIATQPVSTQTLCSGTTATFNVVAGGTGISYQWWKDGTPLSDGANVSGSTTNTLSLLNITSADAANYKVIVSGTSPCSPLSSNISTLVVNNSVSITDNPSDAAVCATFPADFTVLATGDGLTYQWYRGSFPGTLVANSANISGATSSILHFNQANVSDIDDYYVVVSGLSPCVSAQSDYAHLSVDRTITITAQPVSQQICIGGDVSFSVTADANGDPLLYQWRKNGIDIPGENAATYTIIGTVAGDAANYDVVITGIAGCVTSYSNVAVLAINPLSVGGSVGPSTAVCVNVNNGTLNLTGQTGNVIRWESSVDAGATWLPIANTTTSLSYSNITTETMYRAIVQSGVCAPDSSSVATISFRPIPDAVATPSTQLICSGSAISTIVLTGSVPGTVFDWTRDNVATATGIAASGSGDIAGSLTNTTASPFTTTFTITPTAAGCPGSPITATVTFDVKPVATATPVSQTICSGNSITEIELNANVSGSTFTWTRDKVADVTGIAGSGTDDDIQGILTNNTASPITVTFTITPSANGCFGAPVTATVLVNPTPNAVSTPSSQTICSATSIATIILSGNTAFTTFNWTRDNNATITGIAANGSGDISGVLTNTTLNATTVTFTITPVANSCPGAPIMATVLVNPSPDAIATPSSQTICSANPIGTIVLGSTVPGATYTWTRNNTATVTGIAANGVGDIIGSLTNTTFAPVTVTFTISPTANTCPGTTTTATVLVNPTPNAVATPSAQTVCSGSPITTTLLTGNVPSTDFNWTRNNTGTVTGIAAAGSGDISGTLVNTTNALITVTFNITPTVNGCPGPAINATVAVKPTPIATATNNVQTVCSGIAIANVTISNSNAVPSTTYSWTRDNGPSTTGNLTGIAESGSGTSISGILTNTTNIQQVTTFIITATAGGCSSTTTVVITVNPKPVMTSATTAKLCYNSTLNFALTSTVASNYTWIAANNANVTGESTTTQTTSIINNTLVNTSAVSQFTPKQNVVYTVTPTSAPEGCVGNPQTVTVTAYPRYNVSFYEYPSDDNGFTICDGDLVGGGGQNDMDLIEGQFSGSTLLWQYSIGTNAGPWTPVPGPHFNNLIHDTLPDPPSIFSPIGNYYFRILVDGCPSDTLTMAKISTLTINAGGPNNTVCQTGSPAAISLSGATVGGTASTTVGGTWSITSLSPDNGAIRGTVSTTAFQNAATIANGSITYTPPANYAGVVTLTLTSNDPDGNGPCGPLRATRTITLTQAPIVANASTMSICSGTNTNINLTSVIPSTYTWTVGTITGGITGASPGSGSLIGQVLTNPSTSASGTVQYIITPTPVNPATCAAVTSTITVTVTPSPAVGLVTSAATICQGSSATLTATNSGGTLNGTLSGGNYIAQQIQAVGPSTINSVITLPAGTITAASSITLTMNVSHSYVGDLTANLISPCGTTNLFTTPGITIFGFYFPGLNSDDLSGNYTFNSASGNNFPANTNPITAQTYKATFAGISFPCNAAGNWTLQINDNNNSDGGFLYNWTLTINTNGVYTSVFSGPPTIGAVSYTGATRTGASAVVTPPAGPNNYTVTTTDANGCTGVSAPVTVTVNPAPTLSGATQQAPVCAGSAAQINLTGLLPNSTSTINYKINNVAQTAITGVVADASGNASFSTVVLTGANNGQLLQVSGITTTGSTPNCPQTFTQNLTLVVNPTPTLTGAAQQAAVCPGTSAQINLTGLVPNTTASISYTINSGPVQTASGVVSNGAGAASFNTVALTFANNGQTLRITGVTITSATPNCAQAFTRDVTLSVTPTPVLSSTLTPSDICSAATFSYTATSATGGATFGWTRAAIAGISQAAGSGTGNINETLTNTTSSPIAVIYVYTTTAAGCSNAPGQNVIVNVNPSPTLSGATLAAPACDGSGVTVNLAGLLPGTTSTIFYTINNVAQTPVTGVIANGSGAASFVSANVTLANAGQILKITGVSTTSNTPSCAKTVSVIAGLVAVKQLPTLSAVSQAASVCGTGAATISLTGMIPNSTNNTINYTINGVAQAPVTGVNANGSGVATFITIPLTLANNGQPLTVTGITNGTCSQSFTKFTILVVNPSYVWLGVNTNWFDVQNWCGGLPNGTTDVLIPGSLAFYPVITTGIPQVKDINIQPTASVQLTGTKMQIAGTINSSGTFDATAGTIELNGTTAAQGISGSSFFNRSVEGLIVSNNFGVNVSSTANDTLNITDSLAFGNVSNTTLNTGDNITIVSRAAKTARVADITRGGLSAGNSINGKVVVERFIPARRSWRLLTAPLQSTGAPTFNAAWQEGVVNPDYVYANRLDPHPGYGMLISGASTALGFDPSPNNNPSIKLYNPSNDTWAGIPNTNVAKVTDSTGYMVFVRGDRSTQVFLNTAAPLSTTVLRAKGALKAGVQNISIPANAGFYNIVGNPFASEIDYRKVTTSGGIGTGFVAWDPNLTGIYSVGAYQYFYWDGTDNRVFPGSGSYGPANSIHNTIQSSQAFLVQRSGSGTVTIGEDAKSVGSTSTVFRPSNAPGAGKLSTLFSIDNADGTSSLADGALSLFDNSFSANIDLADFKKLNNIAENFAILKDNTALSIEKRQPVTGDDTICYKMSQLRLRNYQLALTAKDFVPGTAAFLEDKYLQTRTALDMNGTTTYHFTVTNDSGAWNPGRFKVVFKSFNTVPVTFSAINAYRQNAQIKVDWKVENELNIQRYELEKSVDGIHFTKIETINNVRNNNRSFTYTHADIAPVEGYNYYRVRSIENNGRAQWSSVVKVLFGNSKNSIIVFPNPVVDGIIHLRLNNQPSGKYNLRLINSSGQVLASRQIQHTAGSNAAIISFDNKIPQGAYQLEVTKPDGSKSVITLQY